MICASSNTLVTPGANVTVYCTGSSCKSTVNVIKITYVASYMHPAYTRSSYVNTNSNINEMYDSFRYFAIIFFS